MATRSQRRQRTRHRLAAERQAHAMAVAEKMPIGTTEADLWFQSLVRTFRVGMADTKLTRPMEQNVWVYACVQSWARNISAVPMMLMRGERGSGEAEQILVHEILGLLKNPNPLMPGSLMWQATIISMALQGEAFWVLESPRDDRLRPGEIPSEIWPLPPWLFKEKVDPDTALIIEWEYKIGANTIIYQPHEVLHFRFWNPHNFYRGLAPLKAALMGVQQDWSSAVYNRAFFDGGADPGGTLTTQEDLSETQARRELDRFEERHGGPDKAKRIALLTHGTKYESLSSNRREMEYLEGRRWNRSEVQAVYGTPPTELGIVEDVNRETSKTLRRQYWENHLLPVMRIMCDFLNGDAFLGSIEGKGLDGTFLEWDTSVIQVLQEEMAATLANLAALWAMGVPLATGNEFLGVGLPDGIPNADVSFVPTTVIPASLAGQVLLDAGGDAGGGGDRLPSGGLRKIVARTVDDEEVDDVEAEERRTDALWKAYWEKVFRPEEQAWVGKIRRYFNALRKEQLIRLNLQIENPVEVAAGSGVIVKQGARLTPEDIEALLFDRAKWQAKLEDVTRPLALRVAESAIAGIEAELGGFVTFTGFEDPLITEFVASRVPKLSNDVTGTISRRVRSQLLEGLAKDETIQQLRRRLRREFNFANKRALAIARTEVAIGFNGARNIAMKREGVKKHTWITAGDEHVRDMHQFQNNVTVELGQPFPNGLLFPTDPSGPASEIINCRCVALPDTGA